MAEATASKPVQSQFDPADRYAEYRPALLARWGKAPAMAEGKEYSAAQTLHRNNSCT